MANESISDQVIQLLEQGKFIKEISQILKICEKRVSAIKKVYIERVNASAKVAPLPKTPKPVIHVDNKKEIYSLPPIKIELRGEDLNRYKKRFHHE